jgi:hypothetical protein
MKTRTLPAACAALALFLLPACGGGGGGSNPTPVVTPTPTPTPAATPTPTATLPPGLVCNPTPPPLYGLVVKVHNDLGARKTLDSRPIVINVDNFCEKAGFASTARFCFTRTEGDEQATACDYLAVGKATDTGRWGPTWTYNGRPCTAGAGENGCSNHPDNQFLLNTRGDGEYEACVAASIPLSTNPDLPGSRCGRCTIVNGQGCQ